MLRNEPLIVLRGRLERTHRLEATDGYVDTVEVLERRMKRQKCDLNFEIMIGRIQRQHPPQIRTTLGSLQNWIQSLKWTSVNA